MIGSSFKMLIPVTSQNPVSNPEAFRSSEMVQFTFFMFCSEIFQSRKDMTQYRNTYFEVKKSFLAFEQVFKFAMQHITAHTLK
jgi:hypothetical protein